MTSIGTGYDLAASTYSPDGRLFQLEYAQKAVDASPTVIALKCPDGLVLAAEKLRPTRLLRPAANLHIERVSASGAACVGAGLPADCHHLVLRAREEAADYHKAFGEAIPARQLAERVGLYMQQHTLYSSVRPFGAAMIVAGVDLIDGPGLFMVEPSGRIHGYRGVAIGRAQQHAKTQLEKVCGADTLLSCQEAVSEAVRILVAARQEDPSARERQVELEVAVAKKGEFVHVPLEQVNRLAKLALDALNAAMEFEEL